MKGLGHRQKPKFKGKSGRSRYTRGMHLHNREPFNMAKKKSKAQTHNQSAPKVTLGDIWPTDDEPNH